MCVQRHGRRPPYRLEAKLSASALYDVYGPLSLSSHPSTPLSLFSTFAVAWQPMVPAHLYTRALARVREREPRRLEREGVCESSQREVALGREFVFIFIIIGASEYRFWGWAGARNAGLTDFRVAQRFSVCLVCVL